MVICVIIYQLSKEKHPLMSSGEILGGPPAKRFDDLAMLESLRAVMVIDAGR